MRANSLPTAMTSSLPFLRRYHVAGAYGILPQMVSYATATAFGLPYAVGALGGLPLQNVSFRQPPPETTLSGPS